MTVYRRRRLTLAGGGVLAFAVATAAGCSLGGPELSELEQGQCITGEPCFYPPDIEIIDCSDADPGVDSMVVFAEEATGDSYPGNFDEMNARCASEGGFFLSPSSETWDSGDRVGLCLTSVVFGQSFE